MLVAVNPTGVITGFGFAGASTKDQPLAETFFALRRDPNPRAPSVGSAAAGPYVRDKGFEGQENYRRWFECYGARVVCPPRRKGRKRRWPKRLRRWAASIRQTDNGPHPMLLAHLENIVTGLQAGGRISMVGRVQRDSLFQDDLPL